jgi:hypothetical protein
MVIGVAFAEMVIGFRIPATSPEAGRGPSFEGIQDVWRVLLVIGLIAIFLSWKRGSVVNTSKGGRGSQVPKI